MFVLMVDRLEELDELLLSDTSPRDLWAGINDEKTLRREIARELRNAARGIYRVDYKVDQERRYGRGEGNGYSPAFRRVRARSGHRNSSEPTTGRPANCCDTIQDQLVTKYMAPESRRSGSLLVTLARDRWWKHPGNGTRMGAPELKSLLRDEARRVEEANGGTISLHVHFLDLPSPIVARKKKQIETKVHISKLPSTCGSFFNGSQKISEQTSVRHALNVSWTKNNTVS